MCESNLFSLRAVCNTAGWSLHVFMLCRAALNHLAISPTSRKCLTEQDVGTRKNDCYQATIFVLLQQKPYLDLIHFIKCFWYSDLTIYIYIHTFYFKPSWDVACLSFLLPCCFLPAFSRLLFFFLGSLLWSTPHSPLLSQSYRRSGSDSQPVLFSSPTACKGSEVRGPQTALTAAPWCSCYQN